MPRSSALATDGTVTAGYVDFADDDGPIPYRMTWVLVRRGGNWRIAQHPGSPRRSPYGSLRRILDIAPRSASPFPVRSRPCRNSAFIAVQHERQAGALLGRRLLGRQQEKSLTPQ